MRGSFQNLSAIAASLASAALVAACVTVAPSSSVPPSAATLAPGATATAAVITVTPGPGQTLVVTPAPLVTVPPTTVTEPPTITEPPTVTLPPVETPTPLVTEPPEHPDWPAGAIAARDAVDHIGETLTVCGKVNGANWLFNKKGHPTWLNLGPAYPGQVFNAVIWGEQRRDWPLSGKPDVVYLDRVICVTGMIEAYQAWAQIQDLAMADIQVIP